MDKWVVFDVDDVICNLRDSLYESFKNKGVDIPWQNWNTYNHVAIFGLNNEKELHNHMKESLVLEKAILEEAVLDIMQKIKNKGYKIGLLTARAWHQDGELITQEFIQAHHLPIDKLVISGLHTDRKSAHIDKFEGKIVHYIDDSIHHIKDFTSKGIHAVLLDRPWNQDSDLPRVVSLIEFETQIKDLKIKLKM